MSFRSWIQYGCVDYRVQWDTEDMSEMSSRPPTKSSKDFINKYVCSYKAYIFCLEDKCLIGKPNA